MLTRLRPAFLIASLTACAAPRPPVPPVPLVIPTPRIEERLGPDDVIVVTEAHGARSYRVRSAGHLDVPAVGQLDVSGKSLTWLREQLGQRLRALEPESVEVAVALDLAASPHVEVSGQVRNPGLIHYEPGLTLIGAIVDCGGFTILAEPWAIDVRRGTPTHHIRVSANKILDGTQPDVALEPGDVVAVRENYF